MSIEWSYEADSIWKYFDLFERILDKCRLMGYDSWISPYRLDIVECRKERCGPCDMWSTRLMSIWEPCGFISSLCDTIYRTSSAKCRLHFLEILLLSIEDTESCV
jgi:hypothetical protein